VRRCNVKTIHTPAETKAQTKHDKKKKGKKGHSLRDEEHVCRTRRVPEQKAGERTLPVQRRGGKKQALQGEKGAEPAEMMDKEIMDWNRMDW